MEEKKGGLENVSWMIATAAVKHPADEV